jgi:hypothetical protein
MDGFSKLPPLALNQQGCDRQRTRRTAEEQQQMLLLAGKDIECIMVARDAGEEGLEVHANISSL